MSSVDRIVTADLPPEPGRGSVVLVGAGNPWAFQRHDSDVVHARWHSVGGAHAFERSSSWLGLLALGQVRVIWDVDLDAPDEPETPRVPFAHMARTHPDLFDRTRITATNEVAG